MDIAAFTPRERAYIRYHTYTVYAPDGSKLTRRWNNETSIGNIIVYFQMKFGGNIYLLYIEGNNTPLPTNKYVKELHEYVPFNFYILELDSIDRLMDKYILSNQTNLLEYVTLFYQTHPSNIFSHLFKSTVVEDGTIINITILWKRFPINREHHWIVVKDSDSPNITYYTNDDIVHFKFNNYIVCRGSIPYDIEMHYDIEKKIINFIEPITGEVEYESYSRILYS